MTWRTLAIHAAFLVLFGAAMVQYGLQLNWAEPVWPMEFIAGFWTWLYENYGLQAGVLTVAWMFWMLLTMPRVHPR